LIDKFENTVWFNGLAENLKTPALASSISSEYPVIKTMKKLYLMASLKTSNPRDFWGLGSNGT
jgi:hypothetical protein